jgi:hypothetical protein
MTLEFQPFGGRSNAQIGPQSIQTGFSASRLILRFDRRLISSLRHGAKENHYEPLFQKHRPVLHGGRDHPGHFAGSLCG